MFPFLKFLRLWKSQEEEIQSYARKINAIARRFNSLPASNSAQDDTLAILQSACVLLERLEKNPALLQTEVQETPEHEPEVEIEEMVFPSGRSEADVSEEEQEPELSATAKKLIELRDWVLLAKSDGTPPSPSLLEALSKQLEQVLIKEGVSAIEDTGTFDYEKHQVVSTQVTDNPELKEQICQTIRPGYCFNGGVVRPQEVVIYTYQAPETQ